MTALPSQWKSQMLLGLKGLHLHQNLGGAFQRPYE